MEEVSRRQIKTEVLSDLEKLFCFLIGDCPASAAAFLRGHPAIHAGDTASGHLADSTWPANFGDDERGWGKLMSAHVFL